LLWRLKGVGIGSGNANEVCIKERDAGGQEETPDDEGLLGLLVVTLIWGSGKHFWVFVAPEDVAHIPNSQEAAGDDYELAGHEESGSRVVGVIREESNEESNTDEVWHKEHNSNEDVPPVIGIVKEAVEDLAEDSNEEQDGEDTNTDNTALYWEATEALEINGLLHRAVADAAAAKASLLLHSDFFEGLSPFFGSLGSGHKWSFLHCGHIIHHHIVVFH